MVARTWRGEAMGENAEQYLEHLEKSVLPQLKDIAGHRDAYVLRRPVENRYEFLVITLWDSMESIRRFAGQNPDQAVVPLEALRLLSRFDESVSHYEVVSPTQARQNA